MGHDFSRDEREEMSMRPPLMPHSCHAFACLCCRDMPAQPKKQEVFESNDGFDEALPPE